MLKVILSILMLGVLMGAEEAPKLPASVTIILERSEQEITRNRVAYDRANDKVLQGTERALQAEMDKLTKAGKLEDALAVKKVLSTVRTDLVNKVDENSKLDPLEPQSNLRQYIIGKKWMRTTKYDVFECVFKEDGTGVVGPYAFRWAIEGNTIRASVITHPDWTFTLQRSENGLSGTINDGSVTTLVPIK